MQICKLYRSAGDVILTDWLIAIALAFAYRRFNLRHKPILGNNLGSHIVLCDKALLAQDGLNMLREVHGQKVPSVPLHHSPSYSHHSCLIVCMTHQAIQALCSCLSEPMCWTSRLWAPLWPPPSLSQLANSAPCSRQAGTQAAINLEGIL